MFDNNMEMPSLDLSSINGMPIKEKSFAGQRFMTPPPGTHFVDCDFSSTQWEGVTLEGCMFTRCRFDGSQFKGCALRNVRWFDCTAQGLTIYQSLSMECHWEGGGWSECRWQECRVVRPMFHQLKGGGWEFKGCDISYATMASLDFTGLLFERSLMRDFSLVESRIRDQVWREVFMERVIAANSEFSGGSWQACQGINNRWMGIKAKGLSYQSCNFEQGAWSRSEIEGGEFHGCNLRIAGFDNGNFRNLNFRDNVLYVVAFDNSVLSGCVFRERDVSYFSLRGARVEECDLRNMSGSDLDARDCQLVETRVEGMRFVEANVMGQDPVDWRGADLDLARFEVPEEQRDADWWSICRPGIARST